VVIGPTTFVFTRGRKEAGKRRHGLSLNTDVFISRESFPHDGSLDFPVPPARFRDLLASHLDATGLSQRELARRVKVPQARIQQCIGGRLPPPLEHVLPISEALSLKPAERDQLVDAALRDSGCAAIADLLKQAREQVAELNGRLDRIEAAVPRPKKRDH
jgi:hypothetical protein